MEHLNLKPIDRVSTISKKDFMENYVKPQIPVVVERLTEDWPAYDKWHLSYIKEIAGDKIVPLYDDRPVRAEDGFNEAHAEMKMSEYIDLLEIEPTNYRIFLYNIMKEVPQLREDFKWPKIGLRLVKQLPMLFFGGENSKVFMHFDIDYSNILHFNFNGEKQCVIFPPSQTPYMYKVPHSLISREDRAFDAPEFDKFPARKHAQEYVCNHIHGGMLYMPEGYWHYIKYLTPSFSMSLRAFPRNPKYLLKAAYNVAIMRHYDNFMRRRKGQEWIDEKNEKAISETHKKLGIE